MTESELGRHAMDGLIKSRWKDVFSDPLISIDRLKETAKSKDAIGEEVEEGHVPLRSVYWRLFYDLLPDPSLLDTWPASLADSRARYDSLRRRYLVAPDGRWAADCTVPSSAAGGSRSSLDASPRPTTSNPGIDGMDAWDPLRLDTHNPWQDWFAHTELRTTIRKDVDRTFPDMPYFEYEDVRKAMVTVLFVWSMMHPDVGYRQGMHELLAVCYLVIDKDSLHPPSLPEADMSPLATKSEAKIRDEAMHAVLDRRYVEHDAFQLFEAVMKGAKSSYEWRGEEARSSTSPPTAPIIWRVNHLQSELVRKIDPQLWERLESEGVEAQIWAIRWIRLIFTRELPFSTALRIWDGVFAEDSSLDILDFVCVAMLLLVRNELLNGDYPGILTALLHFPAPSGSYPLCPSLILRQAIFLRTNISPSAGVEVVMQNQEIHGIRAQPPEPEPSTASPGRRGPGRPGRGRGPPPRGMQGLTSAWIERAQAAGLDKAIFSTVADLRRNLPDTATAYSYLPTLPFSPTYSPARDPSGQFSAIPSSIPTMRNRGSPSDPPAQPAFGPTRVNGTRSTRDVEEQLAELRVAMVNMGQAMSTLLEQVPAGAEATTMDGLASIRDSLLCAAGGEITDITRAWAPRVAPILAGEEDDGAPSVASPAPGDTSGTDKEAEEDDEDDGDRMALKPTQSRSPRLPSPLPPAGTDISPSIPSYDPSTASMASKVPFPPANAPAGPSYPPIYLSSRTDRPSTGLPRVPLAERMAASLRPRSAQSQSPASTPTGLRSASDPRTGDDTGLLSDPLAAAGETETNQAVSRNGRSASGLGRQQSLRRAPSHDPLGAG